MPLPSGGVQTPATSINFKSSKIEHFASHFKRSNLHEKNSPSQRSKNSSPFLKNSNIPLHVSSILEAFLLKLPPGYDVTPVPAYLPIHEAPARSRHFSPSVPENDLRVLLYSPHRTWRGIRPCPSLPSPEGTGEYFPPLQFTCRNCGGGDRGRVAIYRPFGEVSLSLNRTVTCMVLKANDRRTSCPCHDEFRGPRSDYVRQKGQIQESETRFGIWCFHVGPTLPKTIKAGYLNRKIRPYIPNPLRCFQCQRFRHSQTACRGQLTCSRCASVGHASSDCSLELKCVNCSQPHFTDSKLCSKWKTEKEIQLIKTNKNIYSEARKLIDPQPSQTYTQAAKSITVNNSSQIDENITKVKCPPLKLLQPLSSLPKPNISISTPAVSTSFSSTQAQLLPSTSSIYIYSVKA
ncbi:uncharacterized protein TNCV_3822511 [Trichonephila clavipes]|nr:uncharacterized protein TNCV_3822511 [Trichonephila clavipes]